MDDYETNVMDTKQIETDNFNIMRKAEKLLQNDLSEMLLLVSEGISPRNEDQFKKLRQQIIDNWSDYFNAYKQFKTFNFNRINHEHRMRNNHYGRKKFDPTNPE